LASSFRNLILLCKNETGYKNLAKLVSAAFIEGFYSKPRREYVSDFRTDTKATALLLCALLFILAALTAVTLAAGGGSLNLKKRRRRR